jgi:hypothetical protein
LNEKLALEEEYAQGKVPYEVFQKRLEQIYQQLEQENPKS